MAQAVVSDFEGGFGDIAFAGAEEFGGFFHAELAEVLLDGHAAFLGEETTQIKWAAADLFAERFKRRGLDEVFANDLAGAFDAFAGGALGAGAEEFLAGGLEEKVGGQFERFAAEPDFARGLENRALLEAIHQLHMQSAEAFWATDFGFGRAAEQVADDRIEVLFLGAEMLAQKRRRKLDRDETMLFIGLANGTQTGVALEIIEERARMDFDFLLAVVDAAGAFQIEAEFDALRME